MLVQCSNNQLLKVLVQFDRSCTTNWQDKAIVKNSLIQLGDQVAYKSKINRGVATKHVIKPNVLDTL